MLKRFYFLSITDKIKVSFFFFFFYYITIGYKFCLALILSGFILLLFSFIATVSIFSEGTSYLYVRFYDDISFCLGSRLGPLLPGQFLDLTL